MISELMTQLASLATTFADAVGQIVVLPPVAVSAAFLLLGIAIGFIRRFTGAKRGRGRRKGA